MLSSQIVLGELGSLGVVELGHELPFSVRRVYWLFGTPQDVVRGNHAHRTLEQVFIPIQGSVRIVLSDGTNSFTHLLDVGTDPLHVGPGVWRTLDQFSSDCVLLVLASHSYDPADYIHDFNDFLRWKQSC